MKNAIPFRRAWTKFSSRQEWLHMEANAKAQKNAVGNFAEHEDGQKIQIQIQNQDQNQARMSEHIPEKDNSSVSEQPESKSPTAEQGYVLKILKGCSTMGYVEQGKLIHSYVVQSKLQSDPPLLESIIEMYAQCGCMKEAHKEFNKMGTPVSWDAMIAGYAQHRYYLPAMVCFKCMEERGLKPSSVTLTSILKACGELGEIEQGKVIHSSIISYRPYVETSVGNAVIIMYAGCGNLADACKAFDELPYRSLGSWDAILEGHIRHGVDIFALELVKQMQQEDLKPDEIIFPKILDCCARMGCVDHGRLVHMQIISSGHESDMIIRNSLISMYGKCGWIVEACQLFGKLINPNVESWNAMITAHAFHADARLAGQYLGEMLLEGIQPNSTSFSGMFAASICSRMLDEVFHYFVLMTGNHHITPGSVHYIHMIDLLGNVGFFEEAEDLFLASESIILAAPLTYSRLELEIQNDNRVKQASYRTTDKSKRLSIIDEARKSVRTYGKPCGSLLRRREGRIRMCQDCHLWMKVLSKVENRQIIIRDGSRIHHFKDGACSCHDNYYD